MYNPGQFPCARSIGIHPHLKNVGTAKLSLQLNPCRRRCGRLLRSLNAGPKIWPGTLFWSDLTDSLSRPNLPCRCAPLTFETLAANGKSSAKRLLRLLDNLNAYLSASQLGITLASLGLGWVGEPVIARMLEQPLSGLSEPFRHGIAFGVAFAIITSLHIVLGEQAPKLLGWNGGIE